MSQEYPKPYDVANTVYHAAVLSGLTGLYAMVGKKIIKFDIGDPSKDFEAILKLTIPILMATATRDWLIAQGLLPPDFPKNKS
jgi:hypothetical protein